MTMLERAGDLLRLAEAEPARAVAPAAELSRRARRGGDPAAASVAERALGLAALHLENTDVAVRHLRRAVALGQQAAAPALVAEARLRLAAVHNVAGRPGVAVRQIAAALEDAEGLDAARALAQKGAILVQLGRLDEALADFERAVPALRAADDPMWLKRALANRAIVLGRRLRFADAEADLRESLEINRRLGLEVSVAFVEQNLGWLETVRGDVPAALGHLDLAAEILDRLGAQTGFLLEDRATLLLSVGLVDEAVSAADAAVAALARERQLIALPDVRLLLARARLAHGDVEAALVQARRAAAGLARQRRNETLTFARFVVATCRTAAGGGAAVDLRSLRRTADQLGNAWPDAAVEARLLLADLAAARGAHALAREQLTLATDARRRGPAVGRALGWRAEALLRLQDGRPAAALRALDAGLRVLDGHRAGLGAADLRVHAGLHRTVLATAGLRVALAQGRLPAVLGWAERGRASHLLLPPLRLPADDVLAQELAQLRAATLAVDEARREGRDPRAALRGQVDAERRIQGASRRRAGTTSGARRPVSLPALASALGAAALVEYVELDGQLGALTVVDGRGRWSPLGPVPPLRELVDRLPFGLRRLAAGRERPGPALALLRDAASRLDAALLAPLPELGQRPLVVVPVGVLQSLPWALLPSCQGRPVTVAPSATSWWTVATRPAADAPHRSRAVSVAGPGLGGGLEEARAVAALHGTRPLTGAEAAVEPVLQALAGADVAHLAAHGRVHREHPLFSALVLADGPLTGYDLERLDPVPRLVVLAACDAGRHAVKAGDELLGLAATLLSRGAQTVVASVIPTPDVATVELMTDLHRGLVAGRPVDEALAAAQAARAEGPDAADVAAAAGFVCIGGPFRLS